MRKILKLLIINTLLLLLIILSAEYIAFLSFNNKYLRSIGFENVLKYNPGFSNNGLIEDNENNFRKPVIADGSNKLPLVLLGCSYAYGVHLNETDTPAYLLSKYLNRSVFDEALVAAGTASALYILENKDIKNTVPKAKYFVYIYIPDHLSRNFKHVPNTTMNVLCAKYDRDGKDGIKLHTPNKFQRFVYSTYLYRMTEEFITDGIRRSDKYETLGLILKRMKSFIDANYPGSEFIMLYYNDCRGTVRRSSEIDNICAKNGIKLVYTTDLPSGGEICGSKYFLPDKIHPSKEAWQKIIPEFIEKAGMN